MTGYPEGFLEAIDKAMEVHATDRLQSALDWLRMFRGPGVMFDTFAYRPVSVIVGMDREDKEAEKARIKAESENAEAVVTALLAGNSDIVMGNEDKAKEDLSKLSPREEPAVAVDTVVKSGSSGNGKLLAGLAVVAIALAAGGFVIMSGDADKAETAAAAPATEAAEPATAAVETETAAVEPAQTEEPSQELEQVSAAVQPVEQEPVESAETVATEAAPAETVIEEATPEETAVANEESTAAPEVTAPEAEAPAAPVNLAEAQVAFSHWDVEVPFDTSRRRASTGNMFSITGVDANQDMSVIGDWVQRGATIFTLNGKPVRDDASFAAQVLENLQVDPDGYLRVAARYRPLGETRAQNGLLALPAFRTIGLENGYGFSVNGNGAGGWQTVVTEVPEGASGSLQSGDVLVSEAETGLAFEGPESLDAVLAQLVSGEQPQAQFAVSRNGADANATMPLAQE
ncbi:hypothetical protein [Ruegeria sp.]|uniref:hypothetical protein n=1 Tax=Ruegeria sp. TaxID=1879320 RepID=UPI003AFF66D7